MLLLEFQFTFTVSSPLDSNIFPWAGIKSMFERLRKCRFYILLQDTEHFSWEFQHLKQVIIQIFRHAQLFSNVVEITFEIQYQYHRINLGEIEMDFICSAAQQLSWKPQLKRIAVLFLEDCVHVHKQRLQCALQRRINIT
jgi:hypothetical protein